MVCGERTSISGIVVQDPLDQLGVGEVWRGTE